MRSTRSLVIILVSLGALLLPATAFGAGGIGVRTGAVPAATATHILTSYAQDFYGVTVTVSQATGRYGGAAGCVAGTNPVAAILAAACRKTGGGYASGKVSTANATGSELVTGAAVLSGAGGVTSTMVMSGANVKAASLGYLQLTMTNTVAMPTTTAAAQTLAKTTFPKLANGRYVQIKSQPGTYAFLAHITVSQALAHSPSATAGVTVLLILYKGSSGQTTVGAIVGTGNQMMSLR